MRPAIQIRVLLVVSALVLLAALLAECTVVWGN